MRSTLKVIDSRFWRIYAIITFVNQVIRVPILLSLATSINDLEVYFIITATSIPVQFISQDILQYRSKTQKIFLFEKIGLPLFAFFSFLYVFWNHGWILGAAYLIFSVAIIFYGSSIGHLRDVFNAKRVLAIDALYNTGITVSFVFFSLYVIKGASLGLIIVLSQAGIAMILGLFNEMQTQRNGNINSIRFIDKSKVLNYTSFSAPLLMAGIMITTQIERLVIAVSQPVVLACISLAAGITQAWRKIGMDDSIVFERLKKQCPSNVYQAMILELRLARYIFYPPLILAILVSPYTKQISGWCIEHGLFRSLNNSSYFTTASILCIYLAAMPPAVVMINSLRLRVLPLKKNGWVIMIIVIVVELFALFYPSFILLFSSFALILIIINASLSHFLFISLAPVSLLTSFRALLIDFIVFILVISLVLWKNVH